MSPEFDSYFRFKAYSSSFHFLPKFSPGEHILYLIISIFLIVNGNFPYFNKHSDKNGNYFKI